MLPQRGFLPLCISPFLTSLPFHVFSALLPFVYLCPFQGSSFLPPSPSLLRPQCPLSSPPPSLLLSLQFIQLRLLFSFLPADRAEFHVLDLLSCKTVFFTLSYISKAERKFGTVERLHFHFSLSCTGEGNGNPLPCSCLESPRDGGAWWAAIYGVAQSRTRLKRLGSSRESTRLGSQRCSSGPAQIPVHKVTVTP